MCGSKVRGIALSSAFCFSASAQVLLNVRDPEKWYDSVIDTIWSPQCPEQNWSVRIFQEGRDFQAQARAFHKATMLPGVERTWVLVQELHLSYHNGGLQSLLWFPCYSKLRYVP